MTGDTNDKAERKRSNRRLIERALRDTEKLLQQTSDVDVRRMLHAVRGTLWQRLVAREDSPSRGRR